MALRIEIIQEDPAIERQAKVIIRCNNKIMHEIIAKIVQKPGADSKEYPAVELVVLV